MITPHDRPPVAEILKDEALLALGSGVEDAELIAHRIRFFAGAARIEHGVAPGAWLSPSQLQQLQRLATLADQVATGARVLLGEVVAQPDMG
jgi:hypothetical protein